MASSTDHLVEKKRTWKIVCAEAERDKAAPTREREMERFMAAGGRVKAVDCAQHSRTSYERNPAFILH